MSRDEDDGLVEGAAFSAGPVALVDNDGDGFAVGEDEFVLIVIVISGPCSGISLSLLRALVEPGFVAVRSVNRKAGINETVTF